MTTKFGFFVRFLFAAILVGHYLALPGMATDKVQVKQNDQDRLEILARFLRTVYPDLTDQPSGPAILHIVFNQGRFGGIFQLSLYLRPCRGEGVSLQRSPLPYCGGAHPELRPVEGEKPLLRASAHFRQNDGQFTLVFFGASFTSVDETLQEIRDQFKDRLLTDFDYHDNKRYWTENDALRALQARNPKYGPEHKKEFLATLPVKALQEVTSCRLHPESAEFRIRSSGTAS